MTFEETALPVGTSWFVNLTGHAPLNSEGPTISMALANGSYSYVLGSSNRSFSAPRGAFTLRGVALAEEVTFAPVVYVVNVTESGLPSSTEWTVNLTNIGGGHTTRSSLVLMEPNGTYDYSSTSTDTNYVASNGRFEVNGAAIALSVVFTTIHRAAGSFLGLPPAYGYALVGGIVVASAVAAAVLILRRRRSSTSPPSVEGSPPGRSPGSSEL